MQQVPDTCTSVATIFWAMNKLKLRPFINLLVSTQIQFVCCKLSVLQAVLDRNCLFLLHVQTYSLHNETALTVIPTEEAGKQW